MMNIIKIEKEILKFEEQYKQRIETLFVSPVDYANIVVNWRSSVDGFYSVKFKRQIMLGIRPFLNEGEMYVSSLVHDININRDQFRKLIGQTIFKIDLQNQSF